MTVPPDRSPPGAILGIDTGGTFTDVMLLDPATGRIWSAKTPSTPADPSLGFGAGIAEALARSGLPAADIGRILHGTTVATNLILEAKGARCAMLVTAGFRYVLEIARQEIPRRSSLFAWVKPKRPVPPQHIFEVAGRMDAAGREIEPLDEDAVRAAGRALAAAAMPAVAVVFLHAYANSTHERRAAEILREEHPDALVSLSSDVLPVFREYERSMTTLLNVYVMPVVSTYVARLEARAGEHGIKAPLLLMKSSGGVTSARSARERPVETALSGPAAGAVGAAFISARTGFADVIGIDIGGTSADISLIRGGQPGLTTTGRIGEWPLGLPMVDIATIGAGGGSLARVSSDGGLTVGPESAGAEPGPACYGRGGKLPTVTDAHLVLGHLPPYLLDGRFGLDVEAARRAIAGEVAEPLGLDIVAAARGILAIADSQMVGAIRVVSVERGHDPRDFVLLPFGGAGPLHGGALARLLGIRTVLVPPSPGVLSALGLLASNLRAEFARTCLQRAGHADPGQISQVFAELAADAVAWLDAENVPEAARRLRCEASLRYEHQGFELTVPWAGSEADGAIAGAMRAFHDLHARLYGFAQEDTPVEIVTLRVAAEGLFPPPELPELAASGSPAEAEIGRSHIELETGRADVIVYDRARLGAGASIEGPAILTQLDATTLLLPGQVATVHRLGSLIVRDEAAT